MRTELFRRFRDPRYVRQDFDALPPYYGDAMARLPTSPRQWMAVLDIQHEWLRQWAAGDFEADWPDGGLVFPEHLEDLPVEEQPSALDRAVLDECLGGPFHPGCEVTWPIRSTFMYEAPLRLRRRPSPEPDWGAVMTSAIALSQTGPLSGSGPGALTRWMAVPWQTDTSSCLSAYVAEEDEYLPTFWPARVPNDVLALNSFQVLLDPTASPELKQAEFAHRIKWLRQLPVEDAQRTNFMNAFIRDWARYGVVTRRPGPGDPAFPETVWVELGFDAPPVLPT
ncbi:MAG: Lysine-epsilon oxidase [Chloroflexi bacterium]|nr:Lysine-epsilon oxidase [Chloroflexota bacterium]